MAKNRATKKAGNAHKRPKAIRGYASKAAGQTDHARQRAKERFDMELTNQDLYSMAHLIQRGRAFRMQWQSHRAAVYLLEYGGERLPVVYDRQRETISSVLPPNPRGIDDDIWELANKKLDDWNEIGQKPIHG